MKMKMKMKMKVTKAYIKICEQFGIKLMLLPEVSNNLKRRKKHFNYFPTQTFITAFLRGIFFHENSLTTVLEN